MEKKSVSKKNDKRPSRRNGVGFFHEFNPGQTQLLYALAGEFGLQIETVNPDTVPNCRYEAESPELECFVNFELEKLKGRQEALEKLLGLEAG